MKSEKKYLIKSSDDLNDLAHWFYEDDTPITFYFRCVPVENGKILAIFVFPQQNHVAPVFNFFERQYLSLLALRFSRMEYLKRRLNKRHEHEIELLNKIGEATYLSLADPQQALDKILTAMQSFFNVRAIAINIIVDVYDSEDKKTHKETRMQKGLGYDPKYCEEEKHRLEGKSRTAYVARERKTIVAFYDKAKNQYNNYEFEQNDYGGESHPIKVDIGENESFCGFSLPEKKLYSYLGAPIIWQNIKTNEIEVIGVLKMANHQPIDVPFSNNQMASAMRIAKLLSPLIYMIQHRNEYGLEKQVEYLTVLFRGISHELKTPLAKLDNTLALLELEAESELNPEVSKLINNCYDYKDQFVHAIDSLQEIASHTKGNPTIIKLRQNLSDIWEKTAKNSNIEIVFDIHDGMTVKVDLYHLERIFSNLFLNAIEALQETKNGTITVCAIKNERNDILITLNDNGPGVPESLHNRLFNPFESGHKNPITPDNPGKLRGIGLTIAKLSAENSGGKLNFIPVISTSTFQISLPSS